MIGTITFIVAAITIGAIALLSTRVCASPEFRRLEEEKRKREQKYFWASSL